MGRISYRPDPLDSPVIVELQSPAFTTDQSAVDYIGKAMEINAWFGAYHGDIVGAEFLGDYTIRLTLRRSAAT